MPKFFEGKEKKKIAPDSTFHVRYLGKTLASEPGVEGIEHSINTILDFTPDEKTLPRTFLGVSQEGIILTDAKGRSNTDKLYPLAEISFAIMNTRCKKVFAFNHHITRKPPTAECHAVMCDTEEAASDIGNLLYFAFRDKHFNTLRKRRSEEIANPKNSTRNNDEGRSINGVNKHEGNGHTSQRDDSVSLDSSELTLEYTPQSTLCAEPEMFSSPSMVDESIRSAHVDTDYLSYGTPLSSRGSTSPRSPCGDQDTRELHMVVNDMLKIVENEKDQLDSNPTLV